MRSPKESITGGYDIHLVFRENQRGEAERLFRSCLYFLDDHGIEYRNHRVFPEPVGPWPTGMWQFELPSSSHSFYDLGMCISWFMLNRKGFSVMIHPNTNTEDGKGGALEDHEQNHLWLGAPIELHLSIFH